MDRPAGWTKDTESYLWLTEDLNAGKHLLDSGKYDEAVRRFERIIREYGKSPHVFEAHVRIGQARRAQERHADAFARFKTVIDGCPFEHQIARGWLEYGKTEEAKGDSIPALKTYQKVIDSFPKQDHICPAAYMQMAKLHKREGRLQMANAALYRIIRDYPGREREWQIEAEVGLMEVAALHKARVPEQIESMTRERGVRHLQGTLEGDVSLDEGEYIVSDALVVAKGSTVTVKPGAKLRFLLGASLTVHGALKCTGTEQKPILFTSASDRPDRFDWAGVTFASDSDPQSALAYCRIEHAVTGIACDHASPELTNCTVTKTGMRALDLRDQSHVKLTGSKIVENENHAVRCERRCRVVVERNEIARNGGIGLSLTAGCEATVADNSIAENVARGIEVSESSAVRIQGNVVARNRGVGIACNHSSPQIVGNSVLENTGAGIACITSAAPVIQKNRLEGNTGGAIQCRMSSSPQITGNRLAGNVAFGVGCDTLSSPTVTGNVIAKGKGPAVLAKGNSAPKVTGNDITQHARWAIRNEGTSEIDATGNWWGTSDPAEVAKLVFDAADKPSAGKVKVEPLASAPNVKDGP